MIDLAAQQHLRRTERPQVIHRSRLAGDGDDLVTATGEHVDRDAADAPGGTGHDHRTVLRRLTVVLHAVDGERSGETRGTERHRREGIEARRHRDHPLALESRELGIAAIVRLGQPATGREHRIAGAVARIGRGFDHTRKVDAADQRVLAKDTAGARRSERVFVVDVGVLHAHHDLARREVIDRQRLHARDDLPVDLVDAESFERADHLLSPFDPVRAVVNARDARTRPKGRRR